MESNMAPGSENDPRSGCDSDEMECPECNGDGFTSEHDSPDTHGGDGECLTCPIQVQCHYCKASGVVSEREHAGIKELEREDEQANE